MNKINLNLNLKQIKPTKFIVKNYPKLVAVAVVAIILWTGYFLTNLLYSNNVDSSLSKDAETAQNQIKFNKKTLESLDQLTTTDSQVDISNVGRDNPFKPTN